MINYYYDKSFEGLLTAIYEAYYKKEYPNISPMPSNNQLSIFDTSVLIETSEEKAAKVYEAIYKKISYNALKNAYHAFLSEIDGISQSIYQYIKLGFKVGSKVDLYLTDERVFAVHTTTKSVSKEIHLMKGIIKFKKIDNDLYYAAYEPDHNITTLLMPHFSERFSNQNWIIHDIKRGIAALYDKNDCVITDLPEEIYNCSKSQTDQYETLFKGFFKNICINERINPKLQKQFMPKRYWKYLIEKSNS